MISSPQTLREKAAQLIFTRIGSNLPPVVTVDEDAERIGAVLDRCPIGGLVLFNGALPATPPALAALQQRSPYPLLIAADIERGTGQQVRGATVFPHAMAFNALGEGAEAAVEAAARATAREALACGIHITFSPVADVNSDPRNPIIATRAYGMEPGVAGRLVRAYIRGCREEGLLTTAKHFPGHGNTHTDSHEALPVVHSSRAELERVDLAPFRDAVEEGVDLIMTAHVAFPALDASGLPATASAPILKGVLRDELGFDGVVITDSLLMGGIRTLHPDVGAQAAALLEAGVDILLDVADPEAVLEGLLQAVGRGALAAARIEASFARVWALKQHLAGHHGHSYFADPGAVMPRDEIGSAANQRLADDVAAQSVTVVRSEQDLLPLGSEGEGVLAVLLKPNRTRMDPPEEPLGAALREVMPGVRYVELGPEADASQYEALAADAEEAAQVVVAMVVKPAAWHRFGLLPEQQRFVETLVARRPLVLASLGIPYILSAFPQAACAVCTFSDVASSQRALAGFLVGGAKR